jgi:hypothetical protein
LTGADHDLSGRLSRSVYGQVLDATTPDEAIPLSAQQTTREHVHAPECYFAVAVAVENDQTKHPAYQRLRDATGQFWAKAHQETRDPDSV